MASQSKKLINIIFVGHVDNGKSTLQGQLFYQLGKIPQHTLDKLRKESSEQGKASFEFAWLLDKLKEERERGVTVTLGYNTFESEDTRFNLIDAPGHKDYLKNMISGASQADAAVLLVNAESPELQTQTKKHFKILVGFGLKNFIIAVNKMDRVNFSQEAFGRCVELVRKFIGKSVTPVAEIPLSAYLGDNVVKRSSNTPWYTGPSLLEAMSQFPASPSLADLPTRVPISEVYEVKGVGQVIAGRVFSGAIERNKKYVIYPSGHDIEVKTIQTHHTDIPVGRVGENIGISIKGSKKLDIPRGSVICELGTGEATTTFRALFEVQMPDKQIVRQNLNLKEGEIFEVKPFNFGIGYSPILNYHAGQIQCTVVDIVSVDGKRPETPFFGSKQRVELVLRTDKPIALETTKYKDLSRLILRDVGQIVAIGICTELNPPTP